MGFVKGEEGGDLCIRVIKIPSLKEQPAPQEINDNQKVGGKFLKLFGLTS